VNAHTTIRAWTDKYLNTHLEAQSVRLGYHGPEVWTDVRLRDGAHVSTTAPHALPDVPDAVERAVQASFRPGEFADYARSPDHTVAGGGSYTTDPHVLRSGQAGAAFTGTKSVFYGFRTFLAFTRNATP